MEFLSQDDIDQAASRIASYIHRTPVLSCRSINEITGAKIFFKCENFQKVGAFKYRGATNAIQQLTSGQLAHGVITHSSGNHAQALALAARIKGTKAYIVMPSNAPNSKKKAVVGYGAEVIECDPTLAARETTTQKVIDKTKAYFIHPYNQAYIIAGQATAAKELLEEVPSPDYVIAPVGGGGLLSGTSLSIHYYSPHSKTIGAEPTGADDAQRSFRQGFIVPSTNPVTLADGLLTSLGDKTFPIIKKLVYDILTTNDLAIINAMRLVWERMKIIIEPSAAVSLAVVMENKAFFHKKTVGIILSGGNVDLEKLPF